MFTGFTDAAVDFMWGIRFNNERPWFEAHKESYLKLLGTGMHRPLSSFDAKCDNGCFSIDGAPECVVSIMELGDYTVAVSALTAELPEFIEVRL